MKYQYLVLVEKGPASYGAYAPDVPGAGTSGDTIEEALANIKEALELHLETLAENGEQVPEATYIEAHMVEVEVPTPAAQVS